MERELRYRGFEDHMAQHRGIVFKLAGIYAQPEDRDDLAQEIYLQLWRSYERFDPARRFSTWMYRVALNVAISFARRAATAEKRTVDLSEVDEVASAEAPNDRDERIEEVYRLIRGFDELNRALILLHLEGHSYREISEVLGISETNVSTKLNRLRERMRRDLTTKRHDGSSATTLSAQH